METLMFFVMNDRAHGQELWRTDGSESGTEIVADIHSGVESSRPSEIPPFNESSNTVFFKAEDSVNGTELLQSDGTTLSSTMLANLDGKNTSFELREMRTTTDKVFLIGRLGEDETEPSIC
jgi:ELWxxDGT repeat protein